MINKWHKNIDSARWNFYLIDRQILMIATEFARAKSLISKGEYTEVGNCYERAFELLDLCTADPKWVGKLKELLRFREILGQAYLYSRNDVKNNNLLFQTLLFWDKHLEKVKI